MQSKITLTYHLAEIEETPNGVVRYELGGKKITRGEYHSFLRLIEADGARVINRREHHRNDGAHSFFWVLNCPGTLSR